MKHFFKIGEGLDVIPLTLAIGRHPQLWDKYKFRQTVKANSETECIILRYQDAPQQKLFEYNLAKPPALIPNSDEFDEQALAWHEAVNLGLECHDVDEYRYLPEARALVNAVMGRLGGERLGRVLLAKLPPGKRVYPHDDSGLYVDYYTRVVIPITAESGNLSRIGDEYAIMSPGEAWTYNYAVEHEAFNGSTEDRIHLFIDIRLPTGRYLTELPV